MASTFLWVVTLGLRPGGNRRYLDSSPDLVSGRNRGHLNSNPNFCKIETEDIWIAVLVLGWVEIEDIWIAVPIWCQVEIEGI